MKHCLLRLSLALLLVVAGSAAAFGQISANAPLAGVVNDPSGAVVPGATVVVKNNGNGATYNTVTADNGTFVVPSLGPGTYTVTVSATGFKQYVATDVKLMAATPASVRVTLQVGAPTKTVTVLGAGDVIQTQSATVTQTIVGRQITELPLPWRDSTNLALLFPGANTTGAVRSTTFLGLASSAVNISVDGVNTQEQYYKNYSDFFGFVSARVDAIEEATVSTAATTADSAGQGAVQLKFVTRQGSNAYHGSLYEYHRNTKLDANYWFNNRDLTPPAGADPTTWKAARNRIRLNQAGGRVGGPISLPKMLFGPLGFDGHDRAFFFINFENYELPAKNTRQRTILNPLTQQGIYQWNATVAGQTVVRQKDVLALAAANGQLASVDPTVSKLLDDIRKSTAEGSVLQQSDPNLMTFTYLAAAEEHHIYPTLRLDFNLTAKHHLEYTGNVQRWRRYKDAVNSADPNFPGFPNYGDTTSTRYSHSMAVRSTLSSTLVNEARVGLTGGALHFYENITKGDFTGPLANQGGFSLGISAFPGGSTSITTATYSRGPSRRNSPLWTFTDNLTKQLNTHSLSFGATLTHVSVYTNQHTTVPSISFGVDSNYDPARMLFDSVNGPVNFTGLSSFGGPSSLYAVLTGRVTAINGDAYLDEKTNKYTYIGDQINRGSQNELGLYVQDGWRAKPNLTLNYGVRWQLQFPFTPLNDRFSIVSFNDLFGISGPGNLFKPGVMTGRDSQFIQFKKGDTAFPMKWNALAPTVGFAWTPNLGLGPLKYLFGEAGRTVVRGGYSLSFNQPSVGTFVDLLGGNPGTYVTATRSVANNNLVNNNATDFPLLFRQTDRLGAPPFKDAPTYPFIGAPTDGVTIYGPAMKIPYVQSWNFGIQRDLGKNTALEVRYVGNISLQALTTYSLNESNWQNNGFYDEFKLAMANFQANIAAGRGNTFKYFGPNTNTSPLPITLAYFNGIPAAQAGDATKYTGSNWTSTTFVNQLAVNNPNPSSYAGSLYSDPTRRANALAVGLPANLFVVNPGLLGGVSYRGNGGGNSYYDSGVVELRRRMVNGLLLQSSYTFAKGWAASSISLRKPRVNVANTGVVAHTFRANWIYELPFGSGKKMLSSSNKVINKMTDGWEVNGVIRWQSGPLFSLGNVRLVGMTRKELQEALQLRFNDANKIIYMLPQDIIDNTIRANNTSATTATGYGPLGVPTGRYIASANSANCIELFTGDCGGTAVILRGMPFTRVDMSLVKKNRIRENVNFELRGEFLNIFNFANFTTNSLSQNGGMSSNNWAQVISAYRDIANANETGGRMVQIVLRLNF